MAVGFDSTIKPYFTSCYREHMMFMFDLWAASDVESNWDQINDAVADGSMPRKGCPEGIWTQAQAQAFMNDFAAWKGAGFPP